MTPSQIVEVVQAHMDGKRIQVKPKDGRSWHDTLFPKWDFMGYEYRVKPEPLVLWMLKRNGKLLGGYHSEKGAAFAASQIGGYEGSEVVKMMEVLDDNT
jgi:hypothetical protein